MSMEMAGSSAGSGVLLEAQKIVHNDRQASYGHPIDDFKCTAGLWNSLFANKLRPGNSFTPEDIGLAMICVKLSRERNKHKRDNLVDIAGYAETLSMVHEKLSAAVCAELRNDVNPMSPRGLYAATQQHVL